MQEAVTKETQSKVKDMKQARVPTRFSTRTQTKCQFSWPTTNTEDAYWVEYR